MIRKGSSMRLFMVLAIIFLPLIFLSCNEGTVSINPSPTDVVTVTDINKFITRDDELKGIKKTNGLIAPVRISHKIHEDEGVQCVTCHHKKGNDDRIKQCAYCHKGVRGDETIHNLCINCHLSKKKGPAMCQECHKEEFEKK